MRVEPVGAVGTTPVITPVLPRRKRKVQKNPPKPGAFLQALKEALAQREEEEKFEAFLHGRGEPIDAESFLAEQLEMCRFQYNRWI